MTDFAVRVQALGKRYVRTNVASRSIAARLGFVAERDDNYFWALKDVTFDVHRGDSMGIIGRNGAGKSTLLKILSRIVPPSEGEIELFGRVNSLLEIGTGFQPNLSGRENIYLNASVLGMSKSATERVFGDIVEFSGLEKFLDMPVKHYSSGMYSRLAFSVAAHVTGDILALDEVLSVGDAEFRRKCMARMSALTQSSRTILFVSHSMDAVLRFCNKAIWLDGGRIRAAGNVGDVVREYMSSIGGTRSVVSLLGGSAGDGKQTDGVSSEPSARVERNIEAAVAELESVRIVDADGRSRDIFLRSEPVRIRFDYASSRRWNLHCVAHVHCAPRKGVPAETHLFTAISGDDDAPMEEGRFVTIAELPANLFITGEYFVSVALVTPGKPIIRHAKIDRALTFRIIDDAGSGSAFLLEVVHGVIHPNVRWESRPLDLTDELTGESE